MINYSIIIPHHNIPKLLKRCIQSIPIRDDLQIIVVDDCSDEEYKPAMSSLEKEFPYVEFVYCETCKGGGAARNVGMNHAKGKYMLFSDADDFFNFCIHDIMDEYTNESCDIVFFNANSVDTDTYLPQKRINHLQEMHREYEKSPDKALIKFRYLFGEPSCKLVKRDLVLQHNIHFEETRIHNDTKFSYMVGFYAKEIKVDHRAIYCLTERTNSVSKNTVHEAQLTRTRVFAEKNRFLADHHIPAFDFIMLWPFSAYWSQHNWNHFKECLSITKQYGYSSPFVLKKVIGMRIRRIKNKYLVCRRSDAY